VHLQHDLHQQHWIVSWFLTVSTPRPEEATPTLSLLNWFYGYCPEKMAFMEAFLQVSSTGTLICCLLLLLVVYLLFFRSQRDENEPPGPKPLPLLGNLPMLDINKPHLSLFEVSMIDISPIGQLLQLCFQCIISREPRSVDKLAW